jgi:hypothetical protein
MITFKRGANQFIRSLVKDPTTGLPINDATVTATLRKTYGADIVSGAMTPVVGQATYNYELAVTAVQMDLPLGILYEVVVTATKGGTIVPEVETAEVVD